MANPQVENGHTKIANELVEAFCRINLSPYESRVLWSIIRKTYGYQKKMDKLPQSQISELTGIPKTHVSRAVKSLSLRLIVTSTGTKRIGVNKNYEQWLPALVTSVAKHEQKLPAEVCEKVTSRGQEVTSTGIKKLPAEAPQKKERKTSKEIYIDRFENFWKEYPRKIGKGKARDTFVKIKPSEILTRDMIAAIMIQRKSEQWTTSNGKYIPHPSTWLNQERWEDDLNYTEPTPLPKKEAMII